MTTRTLYRPVGLRELELVLDADARAFPPRLPAQPIFYPVMNGDYAAQIAREWNPTDAASGFAGYVTEFDVDADYFSRFEVKTVGASRHQELWVPAEELPTFNGHIRSRVRTTNAFYGPAYEGPVPLPLLVRSRSPREQLKVLHAALGYNGMDFGMEVAATGSSWWRTSGSGPRRRPASRGSPRRTPRGPSRPSRRSGTSVIPTCRSPSARS